MARFFTIFIITTTALIVHVALVEARIKREEEVTTENILDSIKMGIEKTFSEENIKKAVDSVNEFGGKVKTMGEKLFSNVQNIFSSPPDPPASP